MISTTIIPAGSPGTCHNLCPDTALPGSLMPAAMPAALVSGGWRPAAHITAADGSKRLILVKDSTIGLLSRGMVTSQTSLPGVPRAFHAVGDAVFAVTDDARIRISIGADGTLAPASDATPALPVTLRAAAAPTVVATLPGTRLTSAYQSGEQLTATDHSRVYSYLRSAYAALYSSAAAAGRYLQPMVARMHFRTADGTVAFRSEPVLLTHPDGSGFDPVFALRSDDGVSILSASVERSSYRIMVDLCADPSMAHIVAADIVVSPQLANVDHRDSDISVVMRPHSTSAASANVLISARLHDGLDSTLGGPAGNIAVQRLAASLDDGSVRVIATISQPFGSDRTVAVTEPVAAYGNATADLDALERILTAEPKPRDLRLTMLTPPHMCLPDVSAVASGAVLWGGLRARRFDGIDLRSLAASVADRPWRGYICVRFTDGSSLVRCSSASGRAPLTFSPMITYPAPDVLSITIGLQVDGDSPRAGTYYPDPDPDRTRSVYVAASRRPFTLPVAATYSPPPETAAVCSFPGYLAAAASDAPFGISAVALHGGTLQAALPARFGQSSWDFGRVRFYAFGSGGIHSVSVNAARTALSVSLLDPRPVQSARAAVETPHGVMAVAATDLVCVSGSKVSTVASCPRARALLWDSDRGELWLADGSERVSVLCPDLRWGSYTLALTLDPERCTCGYPVSSDTVYDPDTRLVQPLTPVEWQGLLPAVATRSALGRLTLGLRGNLHDLYVELRRRWLGVDEPGAAFTWLLDGEVRAPLSICIPLMPCAADVSLSLHGPVASDFRLSYAHLCPIR